LLFCGLPIAGLVALAIADSGSSKPGPIKEAVLYEQVTIFGIELTSDPKTIDPKLVRFENQLRKFRPDHGFKLRAVEVKRLAQNDSHTCDLGGGIQATTTLLGLDPATGKLDLKFSLRVNGRNELTARVKTPPNQLFFCEKKLAQGERLLIGVGAR
jgi:hypothetical protein